MSKSKNSPKLKEGDFKKPAQSFFTLGKDLSSVFDDAEVSVLKEVQQLSYYNKLVTITTNLDTGTVTTRLELRRENPNKLN